MPKPIFGKVVAFVIVILFVITSMVPLIESITLNKNNSVNILICSSEQQQSFDDQNKLKDHSHGLTQKTLLNLASSAGPAGISAAQCLKTQQTYQPFTPSVPFGDVIFTQTYYTPDESWNFLTSSSGLGYLVQEDFTALSDAIGDVHWYGLSMMYSSGWTPVDPTGTTYEIDLLRRSIWRFTRRSSRNLLRSGAHSGRYRAVIRRVLPQCGTGKSSWIPLLLYPPVVGYRFKALHPRTTAISYGQPDLMGTLTRYRTELPPGQTRLLT